MSDIARLRQRRPAPKVTYKKPIIKYDDLETEQELDEEQSIVDIDRIKKQKKYINFEERLENEESISIGNFRYDRHGIYFKYTDKKSGEIKEKKISDGVYIKDKVYNIDTKEVYTNVLYK